MDVQYIEILITETRELLDRIETQQKNDYGRMNILRLLGKTHLENS